jgi:polyisoprenoid-binding protein YceI
MRSPALPPRLTHRSRSLFAPIAARGRLLARVLALLLAWTGCASGIATAGAAPPGADLLRIDPARSHADFEVRMLWLHTLQGRFTQIAGKLTITPQAQAVVDARIEVASLAMDSARFRSTVLAPDFFDAGQHAQIHFVSQPIPLARLAEGGRLDGQLTLRGLTRPVRFELLPAQCRQLTAPDCRIRVHGRISRSAFRMTRYSATLSDQVLFKLRIGLAREAGGS